MTAHERIVSALTQYDEKQYQASLKRKHGWHNPSALALYFEALERAEEDTSKLQGDFAWSDRMESALKQNFNDRLLTVVLKAFRAGPV